MSEPSADFSIPSKAQVNLPGRLSNYKADSSGLAPSKVLFENGYIFNNPAIAGLHHNARRVNDLPSDVDGVANEYGVASESVEDNKNHLEALASLYSVKKERSSKVTESMLEVCENVNEDIENISKLFVELYPQIQQKVASRDFAGAKRIVDHLEKNLQDLLRNIGLGLGVLEEADKSVQYGKHHHNRLHEEITKAVFTNKSDHSDSIGKQHDSPLPEESAKGDVKNKGDNSASAGKQRDKGSAKGVKKKSDHLDAIGDGLPPARKVILAIEGAFARTLLNLGVVKKDLDRGVFNPDNSVVSGYKALHAQAKQFEFDKNR